MRLLTITRYFTKSVQGAFLYESRWWWWLGMLVESRDAYSATAPLLHVEVGVGGTQMFLTIMVWRHATCYLEQVPCPNLPMLHEGQNRTQASLRHHSRHSRPM
jgi:hypothetical protein